jgi:hypothetical protein
MQILTVNLDRTLCDAITCEFGETVYCCECFQEAFELLRNEDFHVIICRVAGTISHHSLDTLIGLTLISTRIILVVDSNQRTNYADYKELGIELLASPSVTRLLERIHTRPPTSKAIMYSEFD